MGHVEQITVTPHRSLSFIMDDMTRARREGVVFTPADCGHLEAWLNVLQDWSAPLVTDNGRRGIALWLEAVAADETPSGTSAE